MAYTRISGIEIIGLAAAIPAESDHGILTVNNRQNKAQATGQQTTSDLGFDAAQAIFKKFDIDLNDVGILLFVSRTYDYRGPVTAAVLQHRLGIPTSCIAFDIPLGTTGLVQGLLVASAQLKNINRPLALVIVGDTNTRLMSPDNELFPNMGDGAAAFLLKKSVCKTVLEFETVTESSHFAAIIYPGGGFRLKERGSVARKDFGINFSDPSSLLIEMEALKYFLTNTLPQYWQNSQILVSLLQNPKASFLSQVNELGLVTINDESFRHFSQVPYLENRFFSAAMLPIQICSGLWESEDSISVAGITSGEGFSVAFIKFYISTEAIVPLIFSQTIFEGAWVPSDF